MVFLSFFFEEKETEWIRFLEDNHLIKTLAKSQNITLFIAILTGIILIMLTQNSTYAIAYFSAIVLHLGLGIFDEIFSTSGIKSGLMGFLYLEVLDASFSFDGVIRAFAMSQDIFIIMIGLGIGAMFVRSLTIYMVRKRILESFIYLEHGAHYAILALAVIMFIKIFYEVSEIITGTASMLFIALALIHSVLKRRNID
jgi:hypothetical protein